MATWKIQEAKTRFNEVIEQANKNGPQIITNHGAEHAVVLSIEDYQTLQTAAARACLLGGPKVDSFDIERATDTGREIQL